MPITAEPDRADGCPYCDDTSSVRRLVCESPKVQAWCCTVCGGEWWTSLVNPHPAAFLKQFAEEMVLRQVAALVNDAPGLSDGQLKARLITVLAALDQHARTWSS